MMKTIVEILLVGAAIVGAVYMLYRNIAKEYKCGSCSSCPYSCNRRKSS